MGKKGKGGGKKGGPPDQQQNPQEQQQPRGQQQQPQGQQQQQLPRGQQQQQQPRGQQQQQQPRGQQQQRQPWGQQGNDSPRGQEPHQFQQHQQPPQGRQPSHQPQEEKTQFPHLQAQYRPEGPGGDFPSLGGRQEQSYEFQGSPRGRGRGGQQDRPAQDYGDQSRGFRGGGRGRGGDWGGQRRGRGGTSEYSHPQHSQQEYKELPQQEAQPQDYGDQSRGGRGGGRGRGGDRGGQRRGRGGTSEYSHPQHSQQEYKELPQQEAQSQGPSTQRPTSSEYSDDRDQSGRGRGGDRGQRGSRGGRGRGQGGPEYSQQQQPQQQYSQQQQHPSPQALMTPEPTQLPQQVQHHPGKKDIGAQSSAELTTSMSKLAVSTPVSGDGKKGTWIIPERKIKEKNGMVGTRGKHIEIEVNHLMLSFQKQKLAIHYDCAFKPDVPKKMLRMAMEQMRNKHYPNRYPAFDGRKNLYSSGELPFGDQLRDTVQVADEERDKPKEFDVTIKRVSTVDMNQIFQYLNNGVGFPQDAIQALDIVLRNPSAMRFTPVGRSYFTRPQNEIVHLGNGLELWYGFYQSAILGWRPFLNVDVAHKGFPEAKSLLQVMLDMKRKYIRYNDPPPTLEQLGQTGLGRSELEDFNKFIRGLKVVYEIPGQPNTRRVYKMNGTKQPCIQHRFTLEDGRVITIGEYFEREKRYRLRYPKLPSIHVGNRDVCLPPELCNVLPGQVVNKKLDETQTANMVKAAARPADERKRRIMEAMRLAGFNKDPCISEFGVTVNQEFTKVKARILEAPCLQYGNTQVRASKGVWRAANFLSTNRLERWVVITLSSRSNVNQLRDFAKIMSQQGRAVGMNIAEPYKCLVLADEVNIRSVNGDALKRILLNYFETFKKEAAQLVVVVIPERPPDAYSKVKLAAEVDVGLLTQCIKERTMNRMNPATAGNILLKLNAKLNGVNHTVDRTFCPQLLDAPTMLVGADVTHPSPDQTTIPSVAAVAASHDRRAFQYNMIWRLQPPREEIILDLQNIMKEQLMFFFKATRQKPLKVIFYRDGVSEGQFSQVLEREMSAIRRACSSLQKDYEPKVTFLVVQKRHHTRFFPTRREDEDGKNKNVPPGTIVDTMITHPKEMDFYLVSHASLQGTSRPTKYHKLWDENDIGEDDLEELTYYLCHLFSRCTRSVSYPAPTYYAHLAAARGRVYLEGASVNLTNLPQEMNTRTIKDVIVKGSPMFFV